MSDEKGNWLYAFWAIKMLMSLDRAIYDLSQHSNLNMNGAVVALFKERNKLLKQWDFAQAKDQLETMVRLGLIHKLGDLYIGFVSKEEVAQ